MSSSVKATELITWKCDGKLCGTPITTTDQAAWDKHLQTLNHEHVGFGICSSCKVETEIPFKEIYNDRNPHNGGDEIVPVFCSKCIARIAEKHAANIAKKGATS